MSKEVEKEKYEEETRWRRKIMRWRRRIMRWRHTRWRRRMMRWRRGGERE